jgi:hypothetical protein
MRSGMTPAAGRSLTPGRTVRIANPRAGAQGIGIARATTTQRGINTCTTEAVC